jgi:hypothetical protein
VKMGGACEQKEGNKEREGESETGRGVHTSWVVPSTWLVTWYSTTNLYSESVSECERLSLALS